MSRVAYRAKGVVTRISAGLPEFANSSKSGAHPSGDLPLRLLSIGVKRLAQSVYALGVRRDAFQDNVRHS